MSAAIRRMRILACGALLAVPTLASALWLREGHGGFALVAVASWAAMLATFPAVRRLPGELARSLACSETARATQRAAGLAREAPTKGIDAATLVIAHMESIREATAEVSESGRPRAASPKAPTWWTKWPRRWPPSTGAWRR